jgi:hypothetical protein
MRRSPPRARQGRAEPLRTAAGRLQPLAAAMARQPVRRAAPKAPCSLARLAARCRGGPWRAASPTPRRSAPRVPGPVSGLVPGTASRPSHPRFLLRAAIAARAACTQQCGQHRHDVARAARLVRPARPHQCPGVAVQVSPARPRAARLVWPAQARLGLCATPAQRRHRRPCASSRAHPVVRRRRGVSIIYAIIVSFRHVSRFK